jgi:hypothetical protein
MQQCIKIFIIPYLYEARHVSGDTPPFISSLKLHWRPLVFHTWKVVGCVVGGFWIFLYELYYDAQTHKCQILTTLTFKPLVLPYATACKKHTPRDAFYIFRQHGNLLHFSDVIYYNLFRFSQNTIYIKILSFSVQIIYIYIYIYIYFFFLFFLHKPCTKI